VFCLLQPIVSLKVGALPEFSRLVHFLLPTALKRRLYSGINCKEVFGLAKNAKGLVGMCGGVHGRSQGLQRPTGMATSSVICGWSVPVPEYASLVRMPDNPNPRQVHSLHPSQCRASTSRREHP
jgi:hypothetical protein